MLRAVEAVIDEQGNVRLTEAVDMTPGRRVVVLILDERRTDVAEAALLSEAALAEDWNRPEEDVAWSHLQL